MAEQDQSIPEDVDAAAEEAASAESSRPSSPYLDRLYKEIDSSWSKLDDLKSNYVVNPSTKEEKKSNAQLDKKIKEQSKNIQKLKKTLDKEQSEWDSRFPEEEDKDAPADETYERPDVSQERLEQDYGVTGFNDADIQRIEGMAEEASAKAVSDIESLREFGSQLLTGNLPADVSEAVQRASAAGAASRGIIGSQLSRNLSARDLGMTSMQLKEAGAQIMSNAAQLSQAQASFEVSRSSFRAQYQLATAELRDAIRRTDLSVDQLREEKRQFRNKMTLALNEQIINLAQFREDLQFKYAATKLEGDAGKAKSPLETLDKLFPQIKASLDL